MVSNEGLKVFGAGAGCAALLLLWLKHRTPRLRKDHWTRDVARVIGHRGCRTEALPIGNTMRCFSEAVDTRAVSGLELDVQITKDNKIVVFHDITTEKLLKGEKTAVGDMTYEEMVAAGFSNPKHETEKPPLLEDVIVFAKARDMKLLVELKGLSRTADFVGGVTTMLKEHGMQDKSMIISFNPYYLYYIRFASDIPTGLLFARGLWVPLLGKVPLLRYFASQIDSLYVGLCSNPNLLPAFLGVTTIAPDHEFITGKFVRKVKRAGLTVDTWTVNSSERAAALKEMGVNLITTDIPSKDFLP